MQRSFARQSFDVVHGPDPKTFVAQKQSPSAVIEQRQLPVLLRGTLDHTPGGRRSMSYMAKSRYPLVGAYRPREAATVMLWTTGLAHTMPLTTTVFFEKVSPLLVQVFPNAHPLSVGVARKGEPQGFGVAPNCRSAPSSGSSRRPPSVTMFACVAPTFQRLPGGESVLSSLWLRASSSSPWRSDRRGPGYGASDVHRNVIGTRRGPFVWLALLSAC